MSSTSALPEPLDRTDDLAASRVALEEQWRAQVAEVTRLSVAMHSAGDAVGDGTRTESVQLTAQLVAAARQQLEETEAALRRIDDGSYGLCEGCGQSIAPARLEALPSARYCLPCQKARPTVRR
jgi:RNA polymerase-binding transcription factor DksA